MLDHELLPEPIPSENPPAVSSPATVTPSSLRPTAKFMMAHPAHFIALGFGSGLSPLAPGTAGTLWGWLSFLVLQRWLPHPSIGWLIAVSIPLGWWACTVTARNLRVLDPGCVVWDEIVAFWLILWLIMPTGLTGQLAAFVLFRFFDAVKPGPVAWADHHFKGLGTRGGFGIMLDDFVAAFCTLMVIALWRF